MKISCLINLSCLKDSSISNEEYDRASKIWNLFEINNMGDYHDLYLKTDVLLLANMFEKFIKTCLTYYGLDLCHYFSSHGLSFYAILKMNRVKSELISNINIHLFIEKAMRGGISYIAKKYSKIDDSKEKY